MKTTFKYGISAYSGTIDEITYSSYKNGMVCIARKYVKPRETENNEILGSIAKNLSLLYAEVSAEYKNDLKTYAYLYGKQKSRRKQLAPNAYSIFVKMMYAFADINSASVDLLTITKNDIETLFPEMDTVAGAVEQGYLPRVNGSDLLIASM